MANTQRRSDRNQTLDRSVTGGIIVGVVLGIAAFVFAMFFHPWQQIKVPPDSAVELLAIHSNGFENTLYIRTAAGNIYAFRSSSYGTSDAEWRKVEQVNQEENSYECKFGKFSTPSPPGRVVSQLESHPCVLDSESQVNYIILENGSIWKWETATGEMDGLWVPLGVIVVAIGGMLGGGAGLPIGLVTLLLKKK